MENQNIDLISIFVRQSNKERQVNCGGKKIIECERSEEERMEEKGGGEDQQGSK
jgi:hypothetical protein